MRGILLLLILGLAAVPAAAHEFILKPDVAGPYATGQKLPFSIVSAHVFMVSEELEDPANVAASLGGKELPLQANAAAKTYNGVATLAGPGAAILRGHRKGEIWSKTTQGMKKGGRAELQGVVESRLYEKFCKTLLPVGEKTDGFDAVVGDALEIVPVDNPLTAKAGDVLRFKTLYKGQPVGGAVTATFHDFTDIPNTYAYATETGEDNLVRIKVWHPGLWMVRMEHAAAVQGQEYEKHMLRAVLVFPVAK